MRKLAEARLEHKTTNIPDISPDEVGHLIYELQTHQIELELQNEELLHAQDELVEARDRYSDLYNFAPVGYMTVSHKGLIIEVNLTLTDMLGIERRDFINHHLHTFIIPDDQDILYRHRRKLILLKQRQTCQIRMIRRNAEPLWVELDSILSEAEDKSEGCFRTAITDITDRKQAENKKRELERQIQQTQKLESLKVMAGGIAHHYNNLLFVVMGNLELATDDLPPNTKLANYLSEATRSVNRAAELSELMLAYLGHMTVPSDPLNLSEICRQSLSDFRTEQPEHLTLKTDWPLPNLTVNANPTQIRLILSNLLTNAQEAINKFPGVISLKVNVIPSTEIHQAFRFPVGWKTQNTDYACIKVADTGQGIEKNNIELIFDPFFTTKFMGRGLGLPVVLGTVIANKGCLTVESNVGKGSVFRVYLPLHSSKQNVKT